MSASIDSSETLTSPRPPSHPSQGSKGPGLLFTFLSPSRPAVISELLRSHVPLLSLAERSSLRLTLAKPWPSHSAKGAGNTRSCLTAVRFSTGHSSHVRCYGFKTFCSLFHAFPCILGKNVQLLVHTGCCLAEKGQRCGLCFSCPPLSE